MALESFVCARDLFDAARVAAFECERIRRMLQAMEDAEQTCGAELGSKVQSGSISDPMRRVDARIDKELLWLQRIEQDESLMDAATCVLYGRDQDGKGGVSLLLGMLYADVIWWHYLGCETWARTGDIVGYSPQRCKALRDIAFDFVDGLGLANIIDGKGIAEDEPPRAATSRCETPDL